MPLYAAAFFLPTSKSIPYLLEDVYVRGGYRTVATIEARNAIALAGRKKGMMVFVQEDNTIYWIPDSTRGDAAWHKWNASAYVDFLTDDIISIEDTEDGRKLKVDPARVLPVVTEAEASHVLINVEGTPTWMNKTFVPDTSTGTAGQAVVMDSEGNAVWGKVDGMPDSENATAGQVVVLDAEGNPYWGDVEGLPTTEGVSKPATLSLDAEGNVSWSGASVPTTSGSSEGDSLILGPEGEIIWGKVQSLPTTEGSDPGMVLALDENLVPVWGAVPGLPETSVINNGQRLTVVEGEPRWVEVEPLHPERFAEEILFSNVVVTGSRESTVQLKGTTVTLVKVAMSLPEYLLEIHQTPDFSDTNPYKFRSSSLQLEDDGTTVLEDATRVFSRRYAIFSATFGKDMYVRVTNEGMSTSDVTVFIEYVPMEK